MERIRIDDGSKAYEIENQDGEVIGVFRFNPSDSNIVRRYEEVQKKIEEYAQTLDDDTSTEVWNAAQDELEKAVSELVGADLSKSFFSVCGAFSPMANGALYIENVLDVIGNIIQKETKTCMKKAQARIDKYTKDYKK